MNSLKLFTESLERLLGHYHGKEKDAVSRETFEIRPPYFLHELISRPMRIVKENNNSIVNRNVLKRINRYYSCTRNR